MKISKSFIITLFVIFVMILTNSLCDVEKGAKDAFMNTKSHVRWNQLIPIETKNYLFFSTATTAGIMKSYSGNNDAHFEIGAISVFGITFYAWKKYIG